MQRHKTLSIRLSHKCPISISHHFLTSYFIYICVEILHHEYWCASGVGAPLLDTPPLEVPRDRLHKHIKVFPWHPVRETWDRQTVLGTTQLYVCTLGSCQPFSNRRLLWTQMGDQNGEAWDWGYLTRLSQPRWQLLIPVCCITQLVSIPWETWHF